MNPSKTSSEIAALREAALEDLMATTDAQLQQEALDDGDDLDAIAAQAGAAMRETAAAFLRQRMTQAKERMGNNLKPHMALVSRPPLEQIKQIIQHLFQTDQSLGLAFRDGRRQTDADWVSLYDDLVAMGAIKPDDHED